MDRFFYILGCLSLFFQAAASEIQEFCPEYVVTEEQYLKTPLFPKYYPNVRCWYNISAPEGKVAILTFDNFDFPGPLKTALVNVKNTLSECKTDFIEIHTGIGKGSRFCATELKNKKIISESGKIEFIFQSLSKRGNGGFHASLSFVRENEAENAENVCGSVMDNSKRFKIKRLPNDQECTFVVKSPLEKQSEVEVAIRNRGTGCVNYQLKKDKDSEVIARNMDSCQNQVVQSDFLSYMKFVIIISTSGHFTVNLKITYTDIGEPCSSSLQARDNNYSIRYAYNPIGPQLFPTVCIWLLEVPKDKSRTDVELRLNTASPSGDGYCNVDQVVVAEVLNDDKKYVDTESPVCGERTHTISVPNSNYPNNNSTVMVLVSTDFTDHRKTVEATIKFMSD